MKKNKKLVLFDIDGTLIRHFGPEGSINVGWYRFTHALNTVFHLDVIPVPKLNYHGSVDRAILFDIASQYGIKKEQFDAKWEEVKSAVVEYAHTKEIKQIYEAIPEAVSLLKRLSILPQKYFIGVLTGNVEKMAYWKLEHVGIDTKLFSLFVTSDEFEDRISLAKSTFAKLEERAGLVIEPKDTIVIGDAVGDVRCAKAIGAASIITMTGKHKKDELEVEHPDLLVDSLMDERVLSLLELTT
ncbi:MAG: HAD family hydrolase [Patescibacteria group bacterium]